MNRHEWSVVYSQWTKFCLPGNYNKPLLDCAVSCCIPSLTHGVRTIATGAWVERNTMYCKTTVLHKKNPSLLARYLKDLKEPLQDQEQQARLDICCSRHQMHGHLWNSQFGLLWGRGGCFLNQSVVGVRQCWSTCMVSVSDWCEAVVNNSGISRCFQPFLVRAFSLFWQSSAEINDPILYSTSYNNAKTGIASISELRK
jgi:hypothetical protein